MLFHKRSGTIICNISNLQFCMVNGVTHLRRQMFDVLYQIRESCSKFQTANCLTLTASLSPSAPRSSDSIEEEPESEVETSRGERFVNYWITTTFTSTTTAFTATSSISAVTCTPNGWTYAQCPGTG